MAKKQTEKEITSELQYLLDGLRIKSELEIIKMPSESAGSEKAEEEENFKVSIKTDETGLLIGRHGETLNSLQLLLGVILYKKLGKWIRVVLDVGDYRKMREDSIREMVERIIKEVEESKNPVALPYLTPLERRFVHMMLSDRSNIASESIGEGKERRLYIKPR